ncbi:Fe-S cluster assembly protein SufD [Vaginisenegalia massiliensis]|uniref:Fe-S cluster assembly protein SufD n=1 Tax=Vaginisenegalia massiliensis TaxID=2058294 RepID=UPI000F54A897|nr:Fe-S cluster assembly protein SufD [Vaginisenegalia massiliensis]
MTALSREMMIQCLTQGQVLPDWFTQAQEEAETIWSHLALPSIERVRYHRWPLFDSEWMDLSALSDPLTYGLSTVFDQDNSGHIVHAGNQTIYSSVPQELLDRGLIVMDLFEAMDQYPDMVRASLFSVIPYDQDKVAAFNTAYLNGGVFVYVPSGLKVDLPIDVLLVQDSRYQQAFNKRVLIVADQDAKLQIMEHIQTEGDHANSATVLVEVVAKAGAQINYNAIDTFGQSTHAYIKRYARTDQDAHINWAIGCLNDGNTILDLDTYLDGTGSESQVAIVGVSNGRQIQAVDSKVVNRGRHSIGNILQHGVILDKAVLTFNGIGLIEKGAKQADAQQESRVLMLSDFARGDANPILLIEEFEVTAGHAASVGQVDQEQLYYLMSRGLTKEAAEYLVIRGFLGPVIVQMPSQKIRQELTQLIDAKLQSTLPVKVGE